MWHNSLAAGHQGTQKTLESIRREAYWVNMAQVVTGTAGNASHAKLPMPVRSLLTNIPIRRPWQMIAIDILEVLVSTKNNRYLLVMQDYFNQMGRCQTTPRPDSHKNHSRTCPAVLYIRCPRNCSL